MRITRLVLGLLLLAPRLVAAQGGSPVNTELPNPAALTDGIANPTVPGVAAYLLYWNGAAWDRYPLAGPNATNALSAIALAIPGARTPLYTGLDGVQITRPYANLEDAVTGRAAITSGASTQVIAAQGAGLRFCATTLVVSNSSGTAVTVDIRDGVAGTVLMTIPAPSAAGTMGGAIVPLPVPVCTTANTIFAAEPSGAVTTLTITAVGFKTKL